MSYTITKPTTMTTIKAWEQVDFYLSDQVHKVYMIFSMVRTYGQFSLYMHLLGIAGWPVVAIWNDLKQTVRDSQC